MLFHHEASEGMKQHNLPPLWISDVLAFSSVHICTCSCTQKPWSLAGSLFLSHSVSVFKALTPVSSHCNTKWTHGGRLRYQLPSAIWFPFNTLHSLLSVPLRRMAAMNKFTSTFWAVSWWSYLKWFTRGDLQFLGGLHANNHKECWNQHHVSNRWSYDEVLGD